MITPSSVVLGPPGCGKTHAMLEVVQDALSRSVSPTRIGFFTFTRAARQEARERVCRNLGIGESSLPHDPLSSSESPSCGSPRLHG